MQPPIAPRFPKELAAHGDLRIDDYYWMRERSNPATIRYLEEENAYTASVMTPAKPLEDRIYQEILGRIQQTDLSVPVKRDSFYYYSRSQEGLQYPIFCRKPDTLDAPEQILLDANLLAQGQPYFSLGGFSVSDDHRLLLYSVDNDGSETYTVYVKDLDTGELLPDIIPGVADGLTWAADNQTFFYSTLDSTHRPEKVHRHALGTDPSSDPVVFVESDPQFTFGVGRTRSRRFVLIESVNASRTSEVLFLDAHHPGQAFQVIEPRRAGVEYYADHQGDRFLIRTNDDGAANFKLMQAPIAAPSRSNWEQLIPARDEVTIDGMDPFERYLVLHLRENGLPHLDVQDLVTGATHRIEFPEPAYDVHLEGNADYRTDTLRFNYTSLITPPSIYDYNMATFTRELKKRTEVLGGYDPAQYQSERIYAAAPDGRPVAISAVYKKGLVRDGSHPLLLYGYGSYGLNSDPGFSHSVLSLLDRGFVYAIAHVRGGAEYGRSWFEDGRLLHKRNSFTDFIACAEHLIALGYSSPARMTAMGGSAGGLLVGAVANLRPDLFHSIVARVPFVDVVTTMLDPTIPLTTGEYDQWGNPEDPVYYNYMKSYSPYDNVTRQAYPNLLVTTGLNDPRVAYWEPAKWVAKLRELKTNANLVLLKTEMDAGHGGASGRYERMKETAFIYAFLLMTLGFPLH